MADIKATIHKIDATDQPVGRLATKIAMILQGKHQPDYAPNIDGKDVVEVENCSKLKFTGNKLEQKDYIWHSNYPGGLKRQKVKEVFAKDPGEVLRRAVVGMLPKNRLRDLRIKRLKIKS